MKIRIPIPPRELSQNNLPEKAHFESATTIRVTDLNYGNHLGNDAVLALAHEFRIRFFKSLNQDELSFFGNGIIMNDSAIQYRGQGFWGEQIKAKLWFIPTSMARFDLYYLLQQNRADNNTSDVAFVKTGQVFYDYQKQKISKPENKQQEAYFDFLNQIGVNSLL